MNKRSCTWSAFIGALVCALDSFRTKQDFFIWNLEWPIYFMSKFKMPQYFGRS